MARYTIKNNLPGDLHVPLPVNRRLKGGQHVVRDDLTVADIEDPVLVDMQNRGVISITASDSPEIDNDQEGSTIALVETIVQTNLAPFHESLRALIHFMDEGPAESASAYKEIVGGLFPTSVTWYEDGTKTKKIVEKIITRSGGGATDLAPTPITWNMYDTDGTTITATVVDDITYSGVYEVSRTRTIS
jgi:hypothetical protein